MKQRILQRTVQVVLKVLLVLCGALAKVGRYLRLFGIKVIFRGFLALFKALIPGILFIYLWVRKLKKAVMDRIMFVGGRIVYILSHRYFAHGLLIFIVVVASSPSILANDRTSNAFGSTLLLKDAVQAKELGFEEGGVVVDDVLPESLSGEELDAYLEARFQDTTPPAEQDEVTPLSMDGSALADQNLSGGGEIQTRTEIIEYAVLSGDSPWIIAEKFGLSVSTVLWENNLTLYSTIKPGQILRILPVSGVAYTISKGDTLSNIAKKYQASIDEIREINNLDDSKGLALGTKIIIPGGKKYVPPPPSRPVMRREVVSAPQVAATNVPRGKFVWPSVSRIITQYFGWRHAGLDIGANIGTPIWACLDGVVEYSGWGAGGWGNTVVVDHGNGLKTRYSHASAILVSVGQQVKAGEVIAKIGSTGRSTGPHLDLRVVVNGRSVNPLSYLK